MSFTSDESTVSGATSTGITADTEAFYVGPDPKPANRIVNNAAEPYDDTPLREWWCPGCNRFEFQRLSRHHVVPKGSRGDDVPENLVYLCGDGATGCHGVIETHARGAHGLSYATVTGNLYRYISTLPPVVGYVERKKGVGWLERRYGPDLSANEEKEPSDASHWQRS